MNEEWGSAFSSLLSFVLPHFSLLEWRRTVVRRRDEDSLVQKNLQKGVCAFWRICVPTFPAKSRARSGFAWKESMECCGVCTLEECTCAACVYPSVLVVGSPQGKAKKEKKKRNYFLFREECLVLHSSFDLAKYKSREKRQFSYSNNSTEEKNEKKKEAKSNEKEER